LIGTKSQAQGDLGCLFAEQPSNEKEISIKARYFMGFPSSLVITNENVKGISRNVLYGTILIVITFGRR
jgi:hypothetical protein